MRGLADDKGVQFISQVGIDLRPAPIANGLLEAAAHSAQKKVPGALGKAVKRAFLRGQYNWSVRHFPPDPSLVVAVWNGLKGHRLLAVEAARANGHATLFLEEAPLPGRITVDFMGVNAASSIPKMPEFYHRWIANNPDVGISDWRSIRSDLKPRMAAKRSDVHQRSGGNDLKNKPYIFCPLQVPGDSQITVFGDWIQSVDSMIENLAVASAALPEGWHLRIKEHPSAGVSFSDRIAQIAGQRVILDNATNTLDQIENAQAVLTVNSSVGFESIFFDKPVIVLGKAFYDLEGVVIKATSCDHLARMLSRPEKFQFDARLRDFFMSYITSVQFPVEADVVAGRTTLKEIIARDLARDAILVELGQLE
jgi:capsular polysaccharide export protein